MEVTPGKWYAVTTDSSCTVTDANGKVLCTAEAGEQKYFLATTPSITLSDEGATVTKATFNCALAALGLLGGGADKLPAGYVRADFLESTGTQLINTGIVKEGPFKASMTYAVTRDSQNAFVFGWRYSIDDVIYNYYVSLFPSDWVGRIGRIGERYYMQRPDNEYDGKAKNEVIFPEEGNKIVLNGTEKTLGLASNAYYNATNPSQSPVYFLATGATWSGNYLRVYSFRIYNEKAFDLDFVPALDQTGTPCMYDTVSKQPFYNQGTGQFIAGINDAAQLRTVLRKLPDLTGQDMGTLTLSIPAEANTPEMQELLDTTETQKNWELTIQERAAEVATYMLRRVRKVVWVRKVSDENGSYVAADGSRWLAEWCSAIYSPLGNDPTLHGYEPFDSVEQAIEQWGLVPYEYPEDELFTETE